MCTYYGGTELRTHTEPFLCAKRAQLFSLPRVIVLVFSRGWKKGFGRWVAGRHVEVGAEHCVVHGTIRYVVSDLVAGFLK